MALARALVVDPPILLLDEPVSALDPEAEAALTRLLQNLSREKTILVAAHRLPAGLQPVQTFTLAALPAGHEARAPGPDAGGAEDEGEESEED